MRGGFKPFYKTRRELTRGVVPAQESLHEVRVHRNLLGECHVWPQVAQYPHPETKRGVVLSVRSGKTQRDSDPRRGRIGTGRRCCSQVLVAGAVQPLGGETREEVGGSGGEELSKADLEPQLDEGGVVEAARRRHVQSNFSYDVQNH